MNKNEITIRPLKPSDIAAIMQLHRELGWNPAFKADGSTLKQRLEALITEEDALLLVAEVNAHVVGYIHGEIVTYLLFAGREMLVSELFVKEDARALGVGKALLDAKTLVLYGLRFNRTKERLAYAQGACVLFDEQFTH